MQIIPLGVHVLIEPLEQTSSIVAMPELSKGSAERGIVRGIGDKVESPLKVGDHVLFRKFSPEEFELDGKPVMLAEIQDVMGIYEEHSQDNES